jgi:RNA polymerase sigma-70 factor (sigma-E family)
MTQTLRDGGAEATVAWLYRESAVSFIRLAHLILGNRAAAEDVVQDAFLGLYRRWDLLAEKDKALGYVRVSVLNGCRRAARRTRAAESVPDYDPGPAASAELAALSMETRREVARALRSLPRRQREVLVLTYYLELSDEQIARETGIRPTTVRSTRHRALAALGRVLKERS